MIGLHADPIYLIDKDANAGLTKGPVGPVG